MVSEVPYDPLMRWETDGGAVLPAPDGVADEVPAEGEAAGGETELEPRGEPNDGGPSHDAPGARIARRRSASAGYANA